MDSLDTHVILSQAPQPWACRVLSHVTGSVALASHSMGLSQVSPAGKGQGHAASCSLITDWMSRASDGSHCTNLYSFGLAIVVESRLYKITNLRTNVLVVWSFGRSWYKATINQSISFFLTCMFCGGSLGVIFFMVTATGLY